MAESLNLREIYPISVLSLQVTSIAVHVVTVWVHLVGRQTISLEFGYVSGLKYCTFSNTDFYTNFNCTPVEQWLSAKSLKVQYLFGIKLHLLNIQHLQHILNMH